MYFLCFNRNFFRIYFVAFVRLREMNLILWSVWVLVCCVNESFAQYYFQSIYPTIYTSNPGYQTAIPGASSIFTSNAQNYGYTAIRQPLYPSMTPAVRHPLYPSTPFYYPSLAYDTNGRLTTITTKPYRSTGLSNPPKSNENWNVVLFF